MKKTCILFCLFFWVVNAYAQADKQWAIEILHFYHDDFAQSLVDDLHEKGLQAQSYLKDHNQYIVVLSGFDSYELALQARNTLLHKTSMKEADIKLTTQQYHKEKSVKHLDVKKIEQHETVIVHIFLNGSDAGTHFVDKTTDDFFLTGTFLKKIGVYVLPKELGESKLVALHSLHDWLSYTLDAQTGDLLLTVNPELLPKQEKSLLVKRNSSATWIQSDALFLNYTLDYTANPRGVDVFTAPLELGLSLAGSSLVSQFVYNKQLYRSKTQWVYDEKDRLQRWVAGDIQASAGAGIGGASLAGLRVFKNFSLDQNLVTSPGLETHILLDTASTVEVFMDGMSVYKGDFPAGELNLKDIPFYRSGSIQAELIVRDSFGREKHYNQLLYGSVGMLAEGLSEYDYALGVERINTGIASPTYGKNVLLYGHYRYGFSNWFSPSMGVESNGKYGRLSFGGSVLLRAYGQLDALVAASSLKQGKGNFFQFNYNYAGSEIFSPSIFFHTQSLAYGGILDVPASTESKHQAFGGSISTYYQELGGLTARWTQSEDYVKNKTQTGELVFNTNFPGNISLTTQFLRTWDPQKAPANQVSASLGHSFSNGLYFSANYSSSATVDTIGLQLQWSPPLGEGFGFTENINQQSASDPSTYSRVEYRNQYADVSASARTGKQTESYQAQLNSAFVWTEGGLHVSRPVRDGFALVRVNGVKGGMKVNIRNQYIGKTDSNGELIVPYLNAYTDNVIDIKPEHVSLGYRIPKTSQTVTTAYRSGGLVEFDVVKLQMVEATVFYQVGDKLKAAQYSTVAFMQDGKKKSTVLGDDGALYLENLKAGIYTLTVFDDVHQCHVDIQVPDSDDMVNNLGRIVCVVDEVRK